MVTGTRQTLGVMSGQDVETVATGGRKIQDGIAGRIMLTGETEKLHVLIACNRGDAERLASKVLRREATLETGALDVFGEFSNTIGGRARAALLEREFDLHISLPEIDKSCTMKDTDKEWDAASWFKTANGDTFFVSLLLEERTDVKSGLAVGEFDPFAALEEAGAPVPAAGSGGGGSGGGAGDSDVDDALF